MADLFIIEGHGKVVNGRNIEASIINKMRVSGNVSFYNVGVPADTITAGEASRVIENVSKGISQAEEYYHEGTFEQNRERDYITTSIQDKWLTSLTEKEWIIQDFISENYEVILDKDHIKFYRHKERKYIHYIRVARGYKKEASLSEILKVIYLNKAFSGNNRVFLWAACRNN